MDHEQNLIDQIVKTRQTVQELAAELGLVNDKATQDLLDLLDEEFPTIPPSVMAMLCYETLSLALQVYSTNQKLRKRVIELKAALTYYLFRRGETQ